MNSPTELIAHPNAVIVRLSGTTGDEVIRELHAQLCSVPNTVNEPPQLLADLFERAHESSVCVTPEIALPHARTVSVDHMILAVGRSARDIAFDPEHAHVRLVFLVGTPRQQVGEYLQMVSALMRFLKNADIRERLMAADTEADLRSVLGAANRPAR